MTMELVKSLMDESYVLAWADSSENLAGLLDLIQECMDDRNAYKLMEKVDYTYDDIEFESIRLAMQELKERVSSEYGIEQATVDEFFDIHEDKITDMIYDRNNSDVIGSLISNTKDIPVRIEMVSYHDCINSDYFESIAGYEYENSYFGDMVDALGLNPARVKNLLTEKGHEPRGCFPDRKSRDGKEQVSYEQFYNELTNSCCGANLLTYMAKIRLKDLYEVGFSVNNITIPKGNYCGLFSPSFGGGSMLEMELKHDVTLRLSEGGNKWYRMVIDDGNYSIGQVYGVFDSFFGEKLSINAPL